MSAGAITRREATVGWGKITSIGMCGLHCSIDIPSSNDVWRSKLARKSNLFFYFRFLNVFLPCAVSNNINKCASSYLNRFDKHSNPEGKVAGLVGTACVRSSILWMRNSESIDRDVLSHDRAKNVVRLSCNHMRTKPHLDRARGQRLSRLSCLHFAACP